ncbi:hypothetical protein GR925_19985 [Streptomyces sp. HUCO-GS316]|nr:hypothetical protein [Streptomyces sp. HUCO-GS316]
MSDGIHTEPALSEGKTHKLSLVCFGKGSGRVEFTPVGVGPELTVSCDRSIVHHRITAPKSTVHLDVDGAKGATGVMAWRFDAI